MKLFPLIRGQIVLCTSKASFMSKIRTLCEEDFSLAGAVFSPSGVIETGYGLEVYDNSIMVWKIPRSGPLTQPFFYTTLHFHFEENLNNLVLRYHIRFNLFSNLLMAGGTLVSIFLLINTLFFAEKLNWLSLCLSLVLYPMFLSAFNDKASENLKFLEKIEKTFANTSHEK